MGLYVALDAGGTRTRCWVADAARVLGTGSCGTVKVMNVGEDLATERLQQLVREAAATACVALGDVDCTCMGLAGSSSEAVRRWARASLSGLIGGRLVVSGDEEIALDAAFNDGLGVLVIAGTGSHVVGRWGEGVRVTAGGWGPVLGDEGSGNWIGLQALRTALRARDRGEQGQLLEAVQRSWGLESLGELVARGNRRPRPDFAELTHLVVECAAAGDASARDVLERAGHELAEQVLLVLTKLAALGCEDTPSTQVAWTGSVLQHISTVRDAMGRRLHAALPQLRIASEPVEPLEGALWRARREIGAKPAVAGQQVVEAQRHG